MYFPQETEKRFYCTLVFLLSVAFENYVCMGISTVIIFYNF